MCVLCAGTLLADERKRRECLAEMMENNGKMKKFE